MALTKPRAYQIYDIDYKQAVRVITMTNITLSGGAPNQVDGVNLSLNDRILVAGQSNGAQNGIYYVTTLGSGSNGTWSRSVDTDTTGELLSGTIVMVTEGTSYADTQWKLITNDPITIGTTPLVFTLNYGTPFTASTSPPSTGNIASAQWLNTSTGALYEYQYDGTSYYWVDVTGPAVANTSVLTTYQIVNGNSNVSINAANGNVTMGVSGTSDVVVVSSNSMSVSGNITGNYIFGNGSQLTGISGGSSYGNANVAAYLASGTDSSNVITTANVSGGNVLATGIVSATGNISSAGNISGTYILGNGSQLTGISATYGNANVAAYLASGTDSSNVITTANVSGGNVLATTIVSGASHIGSILSVSANVTGGNILTGGIVSATGNITGNYFIGNGSQLTGISASGGASNARVMGYSLVFGG